MPRDPKPKAVAYRLITNGTDEGRAMYRLLPDLELLNVKSLASNDLPLPHGLAPAAAFYAAAYAAGVLVVAVTIFSRRDLK